MATKSTTTKTTAALKFSPTIKRKARVARVSSKAVRPARVEAAPQAAHDEASGLRVSMLQDARLPFAGI